MELVDRSGIPRQEQAKLDLYLEPKLKEASGSADQYTILSAYAKEAKKKLKTKFFTTLKKQGNNAVMTALETYSFLFYMHYLDINMSFDGKSSNSLLAHGCSNLRLDISEWLLKNGADPNLANAEGHLPAHILLNSASDSKGVDVKVVVPRILGLLAFYKADLDREGSNGVSARDKATRDGYDMTVVEEIRLSGLNLSTPPDDLSQSPSGISTPGTPISPTQGTPMNRPSYTRSSSGRAPRKSSMKGRKDPTPQNTTLNKKRQATALVKNIKRHLQDGGVEDKRFQTYLIQQLKLSANVALVKEGYLNLSEPVTDNGFSLLHLAANFGVTALVPLLLSLSPDSVNLLTDEYETPLHLACRALNSNSDASPIVRSLIEHNADITLRDTRTGHTPFEYITDVTKKTYWEAQASVTPVYAPPRPVNNPTVELPEFNVSVEIGQLNEKQQAFLDAKTAARLAQQRQAAGGRRGRRGKIQPLDKVADEYEKLNAAKKLEDMARDEERKRQMILAKGGGGRRRKPARVVIPANPLPNWDKIVKLYRASA
jgi:ankyrin repeat protein